MAALSPAAECAQLPGSADQPGGPPLTLPDEHVLLLWQVAARAEDLLAAAVRGRWAGTELAAFADCAGAGVRRQASDEEKRGRRDPGVWRVPGLVQHVGHVIRGGEGGRLHTYQHRLSGWLMPQPGSPPGRSVRRLDRATAAAVRGFARKL